MPSAKTTSQCQRLHGSRSSRRGIIVSTTPVLATEPGLTRRKRSQQSAAAEEDQLEDLGFNRDEPASAGRKLPHRSLPSSTTTLSARIARQSRTPPRRRAAVARPPAARRRVTRRAAQTMILRPLESAEGRQRRRASVLPCDEDDVNSQQSSTSRSSPSPVQTPKRFCARPKSCRTSCSIPGPISNDADTSSKSGPGCASHALRAPRRCPFAAPVPGIPRTRCGDIVGMRLPPVGERRSSGSVISSRAASRTRRARARGKDLRFRTVAHSGAAKGLSR